MCKFIERLSEIIQYIDFDTFIYRITLISIEIKKQIENNKYNQIYFITNNNMNKSQFWIMLLFINI